MGTILATPVTLVTGFLGAGKTTLVNRILRETHGARIAVIENEFGEVGVDAEFLASTGEETIIQLANGCLCCTVRGDFARALAQLCDQADNGRFHFDKVLIEASGIADPGPIIQTFVAETRVQSRFNLDGVVTLVDARHARSHLETPENLAQIAYADRILVAKADLIDTPTLELVEQEISTINPRAPLLTCDLRTKPLEVILDHIANARAFEPDFMPLEELGRSHQIGMRGLNATHPAMHSHGVGSSVFLSDSPIDLNALNSVLDAMVNRFGERLWRCKGIIYAENTRPRLVLQGVQRLVQISGGTYWRPFEKRQTTLVFIGTGLDHDWLRQSLRSCEVKSPGMPVDMGSL